MSQLDKNLQLARELCLEVPPHFPNGQSNFEKFRGRRTEYAQCTKELDDGIANGTIAESDGPAEFQKCVAKRTPAEMCVSKSRLGLKDELGADFWWRDEHQVEVMVDRAGRLGCGNCGEMAGKVYLLMASYAQSAAVMSVDCRTQVLKEVEDHQFAVIGANPRRGAQRDAVVCDPWAYKFKNNDMSFGAYPFSELPHRLNQMLAYWQWSRRP